MEIYIIGGATFLFYVCSRCRRSESENTEEVNERSVNQYVDMEEGTENSSLVENDSLDLPIECKINMFDSFIEENTVINQCDKEEECAICFESLKGTDIRMLKCLHYYHVDCIDNWLIRQEIGKEMRCPECNENIIDR